MIEHIEFRFFFCWGLAINWSFFSCHSSCVCWGHLSTRVQHNELSGHTNVFKHRWPYCLNFCTRSPSHFIQLLLLFYSCVGFEINHVQPYWLKRRRKRRKKFADDAFLLMFSNVYRIYGWTSFMISAKCANILSSLYISQFSPSPLIECTMIVYPSLSPVMFVFVAAYRSILFFVDNGDIL